MTIRLPQLSTTGPAAVGIACMCAATLCMVALDVSVRTLLEDYPLVQVVMLRSAFALVLVFGLIWQRRRMAALRTRRPGWHLFRSLLMLGSTFTFFYALKYLPLADVIVIAYAAPLIVTALSRPFLGEPVGPWRWGAVLAGFVGVLIVVRPGVSAVHPAAFVALAGATFYAGLALTARKLAPTESQWSLSLYSFIVPSLVAGAFSIPVWTMPDSVGWVVAILSGTLGAAAFLFINAAYARAPAALIVPFEYTGLVWAPVAGYAFWRELPGWNTWLGAAIIVVSGLVILFRETRTRHVPDVEMEFPLQETVGNRSDPP